MLQLLDDPVQWLTAIHPEDRERVSARIALQDAAEYDEEYRILRPDGEVRWIHDRAFPVRDASGRVFRIAGVAQDITRRRELETQLRHTQKMQSIGELAGGVAHDFNNLLTVISTAAQLLDSALGEEPHARELLGEIRAAQERASSLTRQLLAFSRREIASPRLVEVDSVVADTEKMLRRIVGEDIALTTDLGAPGANVRIDPGQLVQVLMNLVVNARDAMSRGGRVSITTREETPLRAREVDPNAGPYVLLTVKDSGTGMTDEVRSPRVLIAQSQVGREGLNLHESCRVVVQFHAEWNPAVLEQQIGRVDRKGSLWERLAQKWLDDGAQGVPPFVEVRQLIFEGTYDAFQWDRVMRRQHVFDASLFGSLLPAEAWDRVPKERVKELLAAAPSFRPPRRE